MTVENLTIQEEKSLGINTAGRDLLDATPFAKSLSLSTSRGFDGDCSDGPSDCAGCSDCSDGPSDCGDGGDCSDGPDSNCPNIKP